MRKHAFMLAAAPLVLLGACADGAVDEEDIALDPAGTGLEQEEIAPEDMPTPTENSLETVDYAGSYEFTGLDGSVSTLTFDDEAGTYTWEGPGGMSSEGTFEEMDGSKLYIEDFNGREAWFAVADGAMYRQSSADMAYDDIDPTAIWIATDGAPPDGEAMTDDAE